MQTDCDVQPNRLIISRFSCVVSKQRQPIYLHPLCSFRGCHHAYGSNWLMALLLFTWGLNYAYRELFQLHCPYSEDNSVIFFRSFFRTIVLVHSNYFLLRFSHLSTSLLLPADVVRLHRNPIHYHREITLKKRNKWTNATQNWSQNICKITQNMDFVYENVISHGETRNSLNAERHSITWILVSWNYALLRCQYFCHIPPFISSFFLYPLLFTCVKY